MSYTIHAYLQLRLRPLLPIFDHLLSSLVFSLGCKHDLRFFLTFPIPILQILDRLPPHFTLKKSINALVGLVDQFQLVDESEGFIKAANAVDDVILQSV